MKNVVAILHHWLLTAVLLTATIGAIYIATQQDLRLSANDPQIQLAEDSANPLKTSDFQDQVIPSGKIDIRSSLAPFQIYYDDQGREVVSQATLDGESPTLPAGLFDNARKNTEVRFTWQPKDQVRIAAILVHSSTNNGFVLAGRSLRKVEKRENQLAITLGTIWIATLFLLLLLSWLAEKHSTHRAQIVGASRS